MPKVHNKYHKTAPPGAVYVGRPSIWGNPFSVEKHGREQCITIYRSWLETQPHLIEKAKEELAGKDLVCFCAPKACHGDVLLAVANGTPMPPLNARDGNEQEKENTQRT